MVSTFRQAAFSDMKIMIWKFHSGKSYDPIVTYFAVDLYLQAVKTI